MLHLSHAAPFAPKALFIVPQNQTLFSECCKCTCTAEPKSDQAHFKVLSRFRKIPNDKQTIYLSFFFLFKIFCSTSDTCTCIILLRWTATFFFHKFQIYFPLLFFAQCECQPNKTNKKPHFTQLIKSLTRQEKNFNRRVKYFASRYSLFYIF